MADAPKTTAQHDGPDDRLTPAEVARRLLAEFAGAFALTAVAAGTDMAAALFPDAVGEVNRALAPGMLVMAFIYAFGDASGAHFNPAVTAAFALKRLFPWGWVPFYWAAQLAGALVAAVVLRTLLGDVGHNGATLPHVGLYASLVIEILLTWILVTVILGTADRSRLVGTEAAIAVGATISLCGLFARTLSGASMNPARSLGPAIVGGQLGDQWIYVVGPFIGAAIAVVITMLLHGTSPQDRKQVEAAKGKQGLDGGTGPNDDGDEASAAGRRRTRTPAAAS